MRDKVDHLKDLNRERYTPHERSEVAKIWFETGLSEGFSMEWVFDRYDFTVAETGRQM